MSLLVFGFGNPGCGDDALGPTFIEQLERYALRDVVCVVAMQLQVEHVADLAGCGRVIFVDADMSCAEPFEFAEITGIKDDSYTSHAMSPAALLHAFRQVYGKAAPPSHVLRIRGYRFELGDAFSERAVVNLRAAIGFMSTWLAQAV